VLWSVLALVVVVASMAAVLIAVRRVRHLVPRTLEALDLLGRELQPALVRVRAEADATRARRARA
jgi:hypothetical protein